MAETEIQALLDRIASGQGLTPRHRAQMMVGLSTGPPSGVPASAKEIIARHAVPLVGDDWFTRAAPVSVSPNTHGTVVVSFTVPPGMLGVLRFIGNATSSFSDLDSLTWRLLVGGRAVTGLDDYRGPFSSSIVAPREIFWPIYYNETVSLTVDNTDASVTFTNVTGLISGNYFSDS